MSSLLGDRRFGSNLLYYRCLRSMWDLFQNRRSGSIWDLLSQNRRGGHGGDEFGLERKSRHLRLSLIDSIDTSSISHCEEVVVEVVSRCTRLLAATTS